MSTQTLAGHGALEQREPDVHTPAQDAAFVRNLAGSAPEAIRVRRDGPCGECLGRGFFRQCNGFAEWETVKCAECGGSGVIGNEDAIRADERAKTIAWVAEQLSIEGEELGLAADDLGVWFDAIDFVEGLACSARKEQGT